VTWEENDVDEQDVDEWWRKKVLRKQRDLNKDLIKNLN